MGMNDINSLYHLSARLRVASNSPTWLADRITRLRFM